MAALEDIEFISYGITFKKEYFRPINCNPISSIMNKPMSGGLWASPVNARYGWKDWCKRENFKGPDYFERWTKFKIKPEYSQNIIIIDGKDDLIECLKTYGTEGGAMKFVLCLDFSRILDGGWKGIYLTDKGNNECHLLSVYDTDPNISSLSSWDVESLIIFDSDIINISEIV